MSIIDKVIERIKESKMIEKNDRIVVGCSGGPDSIFLLEVLLKIRKEYNLTLALAHINHLYRGDEALRDENFVKSLGEKYNIPVFVRQKSMEALSIEKKITLEEAGREIRYSFFDEVLSEINGNKVALAHNLDDQVETFLFRLIRGASFEGLEGIIDVREKFIRPINEVYKSEIVEYLDTNMIEYKIDSTNLENNYTRNSIRLDLIPFIENKYNPKFKEKIFNFIKEIREVNELLEIDYNKYIKENQIDVKELLKEKKYIIKKIINYYLNINNLSSSRNKIEGILSILNVGGTKKIKLDKYYTLIKEYDKIYIDLNKKEENKVKETVLKIPGKVEYGDYILEAVIQNEDFKGGEEEFVTNLKKDDVLIIRSRKSGDTILLKGMENYKKVKDIFVNSKIPKEERENIPIVVHKDKNGLEEIVWIAGIRKSKKYFFTLQQKEKIVLKLRRKYSGG
ncbi:MAG: tRNA lysidine(34) synthetase TilS [Fusobacterium perfoetens]|uniref:tRNA lysidine(34) synthetase TilS n=1 Tax=Fusobacterium perfoetens TaxID=852 RepID=UPI0023F359DD|nr:tRNA lysidine(34) synthetase TilS [Fusobacterium perfoetens]MCI6153423.1 tRNA lysidine(34) synthetase TilS [Fusobacterium perfoetens]MDY3238434.1 tRNA lysidine(34) synthetase TilS [Fusobacterium perfoetens]